jgi:hypothetical protein
LKIVRTNRPIDRSVPIDGVDMFMLSRCEEPIALAELVEMVPGDPADAMERVYRLTMLGLVSLARDFEVEEQTGVRRISSPHTPAFDDTATMRPPPQPRRTPSDLRDEAATNPVKGRAPSGFETDPHPTTGVRARLSAFMPAPRRRAR